MPITRHPPPLKAAIDDQIARVGKATASRKYSRSRRVLEWRAQGWQVATDGGRPRTAAALPSYNME